MAKVTIGISGAIRKTVIPVPNPDEFFHAKIEVNWPMVKVFVENADIPSLEVKMLKKIEKCHKNTKAPKTSKQRLFG